MRLPRDKDVLENARALRKSMTREERHLWYDFLRGYSPRFVRQKVVGRYILDFYCDAAGPVSYTHLTLPTNSRV